MVVKPFRTGLSASQTRRATRSPRSITTAALLPRSSRSGPSAASATFATGAPASV